MTAAYRIVAAERKEIAIVSVACECGATISLDIRTAQVPASCASCGKQYSEKAKLALAALGRFHREAEAEESVDGGVKFRFEKGSASRDGNQSQVILAESMGTLATLMYETTNDIGQITENQIKAL